MLTSVRFRKVHIHKIMHSIYSRIAGRDECVLCLRSEFMWSLWQILFPYIIWTSSMVDHVATKTNIYIVIYDAHISQQPQTHFGPVDGAFSLFNQPRSIEANRPTNANTNAHQHFLIGTNIYTHLYNTHTHTYANTVPSAEKVLCKSQGFSAPQKNRRFPAKGMSMKVWYTRENDDDETDFKNSFTGCCWCCCCANRNKAKSRACRLH